MGSILLYAERSGEVAYHFEPDDPAGHDHDLMLTTWEEELYPFMNYFERNFPSAILVDKQPGFTHYHVSLVCYPFFMTIFCYLNSAFFLHKVRHGFATAGELFDTMEQAKVLVTHIDTYYIGQANLDQVFINFARGQTPPDM